MAEISQDQADYLQQQIDDQQNDEDDAQLAALNSKANLQAAAAQAPGQPLNAMMLPNSTMSYGGIAGGVNQAPSMQSLQSGIEGQKELLKKALSRPQQADLSPLAGLVDAWSGSHLANTIQKPQDNSALIDKLSTEIQKSQLGMAEQERKRIKDAIAASQPNVRQQMLELANKRFGLQQERNSNLNLTKANADYLKEMDLPEKQLVSANRVNHVIDQIQNPEDLEKAIIASPSLASDLAATAAGMMSGKAPTVHGMTKQEQQSKAAEWSVLFNKWSGGVPTVLTPVQIEQMKRDFGVFAEGYDKLHQINFKKVLAGTPESTHANLQQKYDAFRDAYGVQPPGPVVKTYQGNTYVLTPGADKSKQTSWVKQNDNSSIAKAKPPLVEQ